MFKFISSLLQSRKNKAEKQKQGAEERAFLLRKARKWYYQDDSLFMFHYVTLGSASYWVVLDDGKVQRPYIKEDGRRFSSPEDAVIAAYEYHLEINGPAKGEINENL